MAQIDIVKDQPAMPQAPADPNVKIPDSVRLAAEKANSYYGKKAEVEAGEPVEPAAVSTVEPKISPESGKTEPEPAKEPATEQPKPVKRAAKPAPEQRPEPAKEPAVDNWEHRYNSMKGRYDSSQQTIGSMQEQMSQLGDELSRTQQMIHQRQEPPPRPPTTKFITPEDEATYGPDLIDLARRAAKEALGQDIDTIRNENSQLKQRVTQSSQQGVVQALDRDVPNWRQVNMDPRFKRWLSLRDIYSGGVRKQMLDAAYQAANAPRVLAFFNGFISDEAATGQTEPELLSEQPRNSAPRQAAVPLERLASPGRARPAGGDTAVPVDKPVFTRAQISRFYSDSRKGVYAGREVEKDRLEKEIFSAQKEGRVR